ncbi:MAG: hypothetical protein HW388_1401 [Dehalococcoidia bacterium]|nr:hypothetical protein [Dehalococcoidia bacterium]
MPEPNSRNTAKGREFQRRAAQVLGLHFSVNFQVDYPIPIGNPAKEHKFDIVSEDRRYIGESKNYSWTEGGNVPSAKMGFINEAVFYLQHLPSDRRRFIVMRKDIRQTNNESLAAYYFRTYKHLLNGVSIVEIDIATGAVRELGA